jgi:fatty acid desaturase
LWFTRNYSPLPVGAAAFWFWVGLAAWYCGLFWMVVLWHVSFLTLFMAQFKALAYTQHWRTTGTLRFKPAGLQTLFFPHGIWAHFEHHRRPDVPFWALPIYATHGDADIQLDRPRELRQAAVSHGTELANS